MSAVQSLALWYLPPNIVDKFSMVKRSVRSVRHYAGFANGKG